MSTRTQKLKEFYAKRQASEAEVRTGFLERKFFSLFRYFVRLRFGFLEISFFRYFEYYF